MGRSKRRTRATAEKQEKEPERQSRRLKNKRSFGSEDENFEVPTEDVAKKEKNNEPIKTLASTGDNIFERMDVDISKNGESARHVQDPGSEMPAEEGAEQLENVNNSADYSQEIKGSNPDEVPSKERRGSYPEHDAVIERRGSNPDRDILKERRGSNPDQGAVNERRGSNPDHGNFNERRGSNPDHGNFKERRGSNPDHGAIKERRGSNSDDAYTARGRRGSKEEKMECEVTSSQEKAQQKILKGLVDRKEQRKSSSSRSRSRSSSRSRSRSSDSSRSRSPPKKSTVIIKGQLQRAPVDSRSRSSSSSRSRSPTPKRVKTKDRSDTSSSRSRSRSSDRESPQAPRVMGVQRSSRSRSKSSSRSRSRSPDKMSLDVTPADHKEKSFYTEEEESPLPVKVKSRATIEPDRGITEPPKPEVADTKEEGELSQEPEKPVIPTKHTKKISLNRGKSNDLSKSSEGDGEKMDDGENKSTDGEKPAKKRKWGSKSATSIQNKPKKAASVPISTDSLKGLIPDIKPSLKLAEPVLEMDYEDDEELPSASEPPHEDTRDVKIQRTVVQEVKDNPDSPTSSDDEGVENGESEEKKESVEEDATEKKEETKIKEEKKEKKDKKETITKTITITKRDRKVDPKIVRQISQKPAIPLIKPDEPEAARRSPSPARNPTNRIVHVRNLVRPFTLGQLKELLKRNGPFDEEIFWIDRIKSHCFVTYENEEDAVKTRQALHNTRWPHSNPKTLSVDYGTEEQIEFHKKEELPTPVFPKKDKNAVKKEREEKREQERLAREKEIEERRKEREKRIKEREERDRRDRPKPVREWDREKIEKGDWDRTKVRSRSRSPRVRSRSPRVRRRSESGSPARDRHGRSNDRKEKKAEKKEEEAPPAKLLDDLFRKTKATPCIYWLPLTEAKIEEKEKANQNRVEERLKKLAATDIKENSPPRKDRRRMSDQQEEKNKDRSGPSRRPRSSERTRRTSDEKPRRTSDERPRQRGEGRRDSRSRSGRRR